MTPARYRSCKRLLRGITVLESRHKQVLLALVAKRSALQNEMMRLSRLIAEQHYADIRLLLPMSRRVGTTAVSLKQVQQDLAEGLQKETKLSRAREILLKRIELHDKEQDGEQLADLVAEMISSKNHFQSSARK
jgi:hypothetical protein